MTIYIERFGVHRHQKDTMHPEWQVIDKEKLCVICSFSTKEYQNKDIKELAEKVAVHIDELVSNGEVSL